MYTSYIGKKFLKLYNFKFDTDFTARRFFDEFVFQNFFNHSKHFMNVANSSFFQSVSQKMIDGHKTENQIKLERFHLNVLQGASLTTLVGYSAQGEKGTTSGQVTNINPEYDSEDMYASWFGEALAIRVSGGFAILIDEPDIMLALYNGWQHYRKLINNQEELKGNQIETWNGHWLYHYFSDRFDPDYPDDFNFLGESNKGKDLETINWVKLIFALSKKFPKKIMTIYAYNLGQTNQTIGFINLLLHEVQELYEFRDKIFYDKNDSGLEDYQIEKLESRFHFKSACEKGIIGLRALEPKELRDYAPVGSLIWSKGKEMKFNKEADLIKYKLIKLWITAMLNKTELLELATKLAQNLLEFEKSDSESNRGKTSKSNLIKELKESKNIIPFLDQLGNLIKEYPHAGDLFREIEKETLTMPYDNFPLFMTLIRFEYNYFKHSKRS